jgi:hypothetical protein
MVQRGRATKPGEEIIVKRFLRVLIPAVLLGGVVGPILSSESASAALSNMFTYPTQSPNPVASGGTVTYSGVVVTDANTGSTVWVKLTSSALPAGVTNFTVLNQCLLEPGGSPNTVSFNVSMTAGSTSGSVVLAAQRFDDSACTQAHDNQPIVSANSGTLTVTTGPSVSVPTQSPNPVEPGGSATYNPIHVTNGTNGDFFKLSASGLPTGASFSDTSDGTNGCVAVSSNAANFTHASVTA